MIIKDLNTLEVFYDVLDLERFFDEYPDPQNLVLPEIWYCDGAGWNGKVSRECFGKDDKFKILSYPIAMTNNEMEYSAMVCAMVHASKGDIIRTDSQLIANQIKGSYVCNVAKLKDYLVVARKLFFYKRLTIEWIPRDKNLAGKELERTK